MSIKKVLKKSPFPFYCVAGTWILYSVFLSLYRLTDFLIVGALSIIVYMVATKVFKGQMIEVEDVSFEKTGEKHSDQMIAKGEMHLENLKLIRDKINALSVKANVSKLFTIGEEIYSYISKNPESSKKVTKFNDYYFPETLKVLNAYSEFENIDSNSKEMSETKSNIEQTIKSMITVFEKQLDNLINDKTFDVRTDIKVLETIIKQEGIEIDNAYSEKGSQDHE